jgi:flagellar biosynthesis/type III secretory pathway M-ring protein FliF/YscJ
MHDEDSLNTRERALGNLGVGQNQNEPQNLPGSVDDLPIAQTEEERESRTTEYIVDSLLTETVQNPGEINYVTASVLVSNLDYLGNPIKNDLNEITRLVAGAIGLQEDKTGNGYINGSVAVAEHSFARPPAFAPTFGDKWNNTLDEYAPLVNLIIGLLIAAGVLILFFMIMRKFRADDQPEVEIIDDSQNGETTAALMDGNYNADGTAVPALADALTPELLNELIRDRSENVGSALRSWVNKK